MDSVWLCAVSLLIGLLISEYYNRGRIDAIRREQLEDLRSRRPPRRQPLPDSWPPDDRDGRSRDLISQVQYDEYRRTGNTRGRRIGGVDA